MKIDISSFNGKIDWDKVKAFSDAASDPIDGVIIKANEGIGCVNPNLNYDMLNASRVGFPITYYHFATLNSLDVINDAINEANYFIEVLKKCLDANLPLILDIEENKIGLKPEQVLSWINTFFDTLKRAGYTDLMLYSNTPYLNVNLPSSHDLGGYKLWIAAYANKFSIPKGWLNATWWQYSDTGRISGITTNVDITKTI